MSINNSDYRVFHSKCLRDSQSIYIYKSGHCEKMFSCIDSPFFIMRSLYDLDINNDSVQPKSSV